MALSANTQTQSNVPSTYENQNCHPEQLRNGCLEQYRHFKQQNQESKLSIVDSVLKVQKNDDETAYIIIERYNLKHNAELQAYQSNRETREMNKTNYGGSNTDNLELYAGVNHNVFSRFDNSKIILGIDHTFDNAYKNEGGTSYTINSQITDKRDIYSEDKHISNSYDNQSEQASKSANFPQNYSKTLSTNKSSNLAPLAVACTGVQYENDALVLDLKKNGISRELRNKLGVVEASKENQTQNRRNSAQLIQENAQHKNFITIGYVTPANKIARSKESSVDVYKSQETEERKTGFLSSISGSDGYLSNLKSAQHEKYSTLNTNYESYLSSSRGVTGAEISDKNTTKPFIEASNYQGATVIRSSVSCCTEFKLEPISYASIIKELEKTPFKTSIWGGEGEKKGGSCNETEDCDPRLAQSSYCANHIYTPAIQTTAYAPTAPNNATIYTSTNLYSHSSPYTSLTTPKASTYTIKSNYKTPESNTIHQTTPAEYFNKHGLLSNTNISQSGYTGANYTQTGSRSTNYVNTSATIEQNKVSTEKEEVKQSLDSLTSWISNKAINTNYGKYLSSTSELSQPLKELYYKPNHIDQLKENPTPTYSGKKACMICIDRFNHRYCHSQNCFNELEPETKQLTAVQVKEAAISKINEVVVKNSENTLRKQKSPHPIMLEQTTIQPKKKVKFSASIDFEPKQKENQPIRLFIAFLFIILLGALLLFLIEDIQRH